MQYKTGDILIVYASIPFIDHLAIVFHQEGKPFVSHNMPNRKESVLIEPLEEFLSSKKIRGVISTNGRHTDQEIYDRSMVLNEQGKKWSLFKYNCEDFVRDMCGCTWGLNQRRKFGIVFLGLIILIGGIYLLTRKR